METFAEIATAMDFQFTLSEPISGAQKWSGVIDDIVGDHADIGVAHFFLIDYRFFY